MALKERRETARAARAAAALVTVKFPAPALRTRASAACSVMCVTRASLSAQDASVYNQQRRRQQRGHRVHDSDLQERGVSNRSTRAGVLSAGLPGVSWAPRTVGARRGANTGFTLSPDGSMDTRLCFPALLQPFPLWSREPPPSRIVPVWLVVLQPTVRIASSEDGSRAPPQNLVPSRHTVGLGLKSLESPRGRHRQAEPA